MNGSARWLTVTYGLGTLLGLGLAVWSLPALYRFNSYPSSTGWTVSMLAGALLAAVLGAFVLYRGWRPSRQRPGAAVQFLAALMAVEALAAAVIGIWFLLSAVLTGLSTNAETRSYGGLIAIIGVVIAGLALILFGASFWLLRGQWFCLGLALLVQAVAVASALLRLRWAATNGEPSDYIAPLLLLACALPALVVSAVPATWRWAARRRERLYS